MTPLLLHSVNYVPGKYQVLKGRKGIKVELASAGRKQLGCEPALYRARFIKGYRSGEVFSFSCEARNWAFSSVRLSNRDSACTSRAIAASSTSVTAIPTD